MWESGKSLFSRLLDGVDPQVIDEVTHSAEHIPQVLEVTEVRIRWMGHRLLADVNIAVQADLSVEQGHAIAGEVRHQLLHHLPYLEMPRFTLTLPRPTSTNRAISKSKIPPIPHPCGVNPHGSFVIATSRPIAPLRHPKPAAIRAEVHAGLVAQVLSVPSWTP